MARTFDVRISGTELDRFADSLSIDKPAIIRHALSLYFYVVNEIKENSGKQLAWTDKENPNAVDRIIHVPGLCRPVLRR